MHHGRLSFPLATLLAAPLALTAVARTVDAVGANVGPYASISLGASGANLVDVTVPRRNRDEADCTVKAFVGYQLTEHFGVQADHVRLGRYRGGFDVSGGTVQQPVSGRSLCVADSLVGSKTSPLVGSGLEHQLDRGLGITIDYDASGNLSNKLGASALTFGVRVVF